MMTELSLFGRPANKIRLPEIHNETREKPSVRQTDCCCSDSVSRRGKGRTRRRERTQDHPFVRQTDCCCSDSVSRRGKGRTRRRAHTRPSIRPSDRLLPFRFGIAARKGANAAESAQDHPFVRQTDCCRSDSVSRRGKGRTRRREHTRPSISSVDRLPLFRFSIARGKGRTRRREQHTRPSIRPSDRLPPVPIQYRGEGRDERGGESTHKTIHPSVRQTAPVPIRYARRGEGANAAEKSARKTSVRQTGCCRSDAASRRGEGANAAEKTHEKPSVRQTDCCRSDAASRRGKGRTRRREHTQDHPFVRQTDCPCSDSVSRRGKGRTPPKVYTTAVTEAAPMLYRTFIHSSSVAPRVTTSSVRRMCFPRISAFRTGENAPTGLARRSSPFKEDWGLVRRVRTRRRARGLPEKRAIRRAIY